MIEPVLTLTIGHNDLYKDAWKIREALREGQRVQLIDGCAGNWVGYFEESRILFELFDISIEEFPVWHLLNTVEFPLYDAFWFCCEYWFRTRSRQWVEEEYKV